MTAPIHCCHRGCTLTVWAAGETGPEVNCSSATCLTCRRVALCLPHFETITHAARGLRCAHCSGSRWYVCLFEPARIDVALRAAVEAAGGRIEARHSRRAGAAPRAEQGGGRVARHTADRIDRHDLDRDAIAHRDDDPFANHARAVAAARTADASERDARVGGDPGPIRRRTGPPPLPAQRAAAARAAGAARGDASRADANRGDAAHSEAPRADAIRADAIRADAIRADAIRGDVTRGDASRADAHRADPDRGETHHAAADRVPSDAARPPSAATVGAATSHLEAARSTASRALPDHAAPSAVAATEARPAPTRTAAIDAESPRSRGDASRAEPRRAAPTADRAEPRRAAPTADRADARRVPPTADRAESRRAAPTADRAEPRRAAPTADRAEPRRAAPTAVESRPDPVLHPWRWLPLRSIPADARVAAPGVLLRRLGAAVRPIVDGVALDVALPAIDTVARAPGAGSHLVIAGRTAEGTTGLIWLDAAGHRLDMAPPLGGRLISPAFVDERRFVYIAVLDDRAELREATLENATRLRTRRIASLGVIPLAPLPPPAVFQHREAVVTFAAGDGGLRPVRIRLADGHATPLDTAQSLPRCLVAAPLGSLAAWITSEGEVRCAGPGLPPRVLGQTDAALLAIADDGASVAWVAHGHLTVAHPRSGEVQTRPLPEPIAALAWAPRPMRSARAMS